MGRKAGDSMAGVSTQFEIQDRMTSKLNRINAASQEVDQTLENVGNTTDMVEDRTTKAAQAMKIAWQMMSESGISKSEALSAAWDQVGRKINDASDKVEKFNQKQKHAAKGTHDVKNAWDQVSGYIKSAMAAVSAKKVIELADSMTTTRARLDLMNDGLQTTAELQDMIMESANRSRAAYTTTADAVAKMGIMAGDAFSSNEELIAFSELINKQFTIAGTSVAGIDAAMLQLTQAMSSGVLRGEELNSIFEQAPTIIQTIADYLGVPIGKIREMAAEGQITSTVVKNAMLASADEINAKFASMPMTFSQAWTVAKNIILEAFTPVLTLIGQGAQWIYDNWSTIAPIFWGIAAAVLFYAVATWIANGAAMAFFTTLLTSPLFWIAVVIGVIIAAIYKWVQSIGGLKVVWLIVVNAFLTHWDRLKIGFMIGITWIQNMWNNLQLTFYKVGVNIQNFMGDMKAGVLTILQNLVNGAINIINDFINMLNKIPGVNIGLIDQVTFGTTAALENEAAKQARAADLAAYQDKINSQIEERNAALNAMASEAQAEKSQREAEIAAAKAEAAAAGSEATGSGGEDYFGGGGGGGSGNIGNVDYVDSVGSIEDDVNIAEEDLKFLRDVAEMRYVQNFVTLTPTVAVDAKISEKVDVDEVVSRIEDRLETEFEAAAEGVYA